MNDILKSDLTIDLAKFQTPACPVTAKTNEHILNLGAANPRWWEIGAQQYREMRDAGETPLPAPVFLDGGEDITIPSREEGRSIPCRLFKPEGNAQPKGVFMHIHGGGWVLASHRNYDSLLKGFANAGNLIAISVGYRLAPEHPFPAGPEDCYDAVEWLADHAEKGYGAPLQFIGGESAGAHLSALSCFRLLDSRPNIALKGLVLTFGAFNLGPSFPSQRHFDRGLVLTPEIMDRFGEAFLPNTSAEDRTRPEISPFFANLEAKKLPPAIFCCGTYDPLLDDTIMMSLKWLMAGGEAITKIYPGAPHGFIGFPEEMMPSAKPCLTAIMTFVKVKAGN